MKIRKFNSSNGTIETFKTINQDFNWNYKDADGKTKHYDYKDLTPLKLAYNSASGKLYLAAIVFSGHSTATILYDITNSISVATYDVNHVAARYMDFIAFPDAESVMYGVTASHELNIFEGKLNQSQVEQVVSSTTYNAIDLTDYYGYAPVAAAHATANNLYVFGRSKMYDLQRFPVKVKKIVEYDGSRYDSVSTYNGKMYMTMADTVYEMATDGNMITFVKGNVIFYDDNSKSIRRINL